MARARLLAVRYQLTIMHFTFKHPMSGIVDMGAHGGFRSLSILGGDGVDDGQMFVLYQSQARPFVQVRIRHHESDKHLPDPAKF